MTAYNRKHHDYRRQYLIKTSKENRRHHIIENIIMTEDTYNKAHYKNRGQHIKENILITEERIYLKLRNNWCLSTWMGDRFSVVLPMHTMSAKSLKPRDLPCLSLIKNL